ncbi:hypothetical protein OIU85_006188 [Salix viminalis]|uniref:YTH domain-containing family protein n=1 Tax=Salix viminalis TaxID=40686 RepID=A0A9Q0PKF8_SALVM|nr:hypothetical protein OIU85_006188 [Salix viminalis]
MKNQLAVKAHTTKLRNDNGQGNIIIQADQHNKDDFPTDYADAKFFVIKSYSEDDVHKSIKYNVWSSTPHGNKKLHSAYEDARKLDLGRPRGCPIFLFFSVNASGQFCGVAEMVGPVDFNRDMDFWQQDKWSGSFLVKWHIIKDIPNSSFRHIILENNENKPVTNSRDTQEIMYKQGLEMLKMFKNLPLKTSILDDFVYYENRQKIMQEEKARLMFKSFQSPLFVPALNPAHELNGLVQKSLEKDETGKKLRQTKMGRLWIRMNLTARRTLGPLPLSNSLQIQMLPFQAWIKISGQDTADADDDTGPVLKIGSLDINPTQFSPNAANKSADIVTVGSMPVKVNRIAESSGFLTVGTIPLDPRSLQLDKGGASGKQGSQY